MTSYLGLVPREYSSGEHQHRGRILRSAHPHVQSLLVQAAWRMSRSSDAKTAGLRAWADAITHRRGKKVAMVALARRLARILFAMWRDETEYQAEACSSDSRRGSGDRGRRAAVGRRNRRGRQAGGASARGHLAAVESRPTESAAPPSDLTVRRHAECHTRARIKG